MSHFRAADSIALSGNHTPPLLSDSFARSALAKNHLFAPKAGVDLRHDVADAARQGAGKTRHAARQVRHTARHAQQQAADIYDAAQTKVGDAYQAVLEAAQNLPAQARQAVARQTEPVAAALEAGQEAYAQEKKSQASA